MKQVVILPTKGSKFLDRLSKWWRWLRGYKKKSENESFQKNFQKNTCEIERSCTFAPGNAPDTVSQTRRKTRRTRS
jgi:hypothetical protein